MKSRFLLLSLGGFGYRLSFSDSRLVTSTLYKIDGKDFCCRTRLSDFINLSPISLSSITGPGIDEDLSRRHRRN